MNSTTFKIITLVWKTDPTPAMTVALIASAVLMVGIGQSACSAIGRTPTRTESQSFLQSPNYEARRFKNPIQVEEAPFFKTVGAYIRGAGNSRPNQDIPVAKPDKNEVQKFLQQKFRITWLGHSTTLVELEGIHLLIDPVWGKRCSPLSAIGPERFHSSPLSLDELPAIDVVLISHDHYDHLEMETAMFLGGKGVRFIVPLGVGARLKGWDIPAAQIEELDWWEKADVGHVAVTATPARHFSGRSLIMADRDETLWAGFAMVGPTHRVYYSGDTGMFDGLVDIGSRLGPFDVVLVEIGAYDQLWPDVHLGPEQAVQVAEDVGGKFIIPVHWATFNLALHSWTEPIERFVAAAVGRGVSIAVAKPGQSIAPENPPNLEKWWPSLPWRNAAEYPLVSSGLSQKKNNEGRTK